MKIAMIGNSHLAALKLAADGGAEIASEAEIEWFGGTGDRMLGLELGKSRLITKNQYLREQLQKSSGGSSEIDLLRYDHIVLVGLGIGPAEPLRSLSGFASARNSKDVRSVRLISDACVRDIMKQFVEQSTAKYLANLIRQVTQVPITFVLAPFWCRELLERGDHRSAVLLGQLEDVSDWKSEYLKTALSMIETFPNAASIAQPEGTMRDGLWTDFKFTLAAIRDDPTQGDYGHMNAAYGNRVIERLRLRLQ